MSLADELLADLEYMPAEDGVKTVAAREERDPSSGATNHTVGGATHKWQSVRAQLSVSTTEQFQRLAQCIQSALQLTRDCAMDCEAASGEDGEEERDGVQRAHTEAADYSLVVEASRMIHDIDTELLAIHKYCRQLFGQRFPELDSLVTTPMEYVWTAQELGNDLQARVKNNERLQQFLSQATIMVVSVTASTTRGSRLRDDELALLQEACALACQLNESRTAAFEYIETGMHVIAPNLTALVGSDTAAKLIGSTGGILQLSRMPACNISLVGAGSAFAQSGAFGLSQTRSVLHNGHVFYSQLVQSLPGDLRQRACRVLAAKVALAARVDAHSASATDGAVGAKLREQIIHKMEKMQEAPPIKAVKPLPAPVEVVGKKRGGKRVRKMKERYAVTALRKQQNRMNFGQIEDDLYQEDLAYSRGTIGQGGPTGRVRASAVEDRSRVRISKRLQRHLQQQQQKSAAATTTGGGVASSVQNRLAAGTASSVAFTPLQGLEIINPQAAEKRAETADGKYFSSTSAFLNLHK